MAKFAVSVIIVSYMGFLMVVLKMQDKTKFMPKHTILVVDDELAIREMLCIALQAADYNTLQAENAHQAHATIVDRHPDLVLLDWMMPGTSRLEL